MSNYPDLSLIEIGEENFRMLGITPVVKSRRGDGICPKCRKNERGNQPYCNPCRAAYQRERRVNNPEQTKKETAYVRAYKERLKKGLVLFRGT